MKKKKGTFDSDEILVTGNATFIFGGDQTIFSFSLRIALVSNAGTINLFPCFTEERVRLGYPKKEKENICKILLFNFLTFFFNYNLISFKFNQLKHFHNFFFLKKNNES